MEKEITSVNNELVKETVKLQQKKYRDEEKKFLLEGFKPIEEAYKANIEIEKVFVLKEKEGKYNFLKEKCILTNEAVLKKISTTDSAPEAVAVAKQKIFALDDIKSAKKVILLGNIKDLGNLGTILRTAKAFSIDAVILYGDTVDLYNPKCVRSAVGNLWKIPVVQIKDFKTLEKTFASYEKVATLPQASRGKQNAEHLAEHFAKLSSETETESFRWRSERSRLTRAQDDEIILLKDFKAKPPYLIMFGSEAEGLSQDLIDFSTQKITIEMNSEVESLNLSVSVGIILHAFSL